jgi:hypothetical protein
MMGKFISSFFIMNLKMKCLKKKLLQSKVFSKDTHTYGKAPKKDIVV